MKVKYVTVAMQCLHLFSSKQEARPSCMMYPDIYVQTYKYIRNVCGDIRDVCVGEVNISVLLYANNVVWWAEKPDYLLWTWDRLCDTVRHTDLKMNASKIKVFLHDRETRVNDCKAHINGKFLCFGSMFARKEKVKEF